MKTEDIKKRFEKDSKANADLIASSIEKLKEAEAALSAAKYQTEAAAKVDDPAAYHIAKDNERKAEDTVEFYNKQQNCKESKAYLDSIDNLKKELQINRAALIVENTKKVKALAAQITELVNGYEKDQAAIDNVFAEMKLFDMIRKGDKITAFGAYVQHLPLIAAVTPDYEKMVEAIKG